MSTPLDAVRSHHRSILERLSRLIQELDKDPGGSAALELDQLLSHELVEHARSEEAVLYPAVDPLVARYGRPTATMRIDHEHIERFVQQLRDTLRTIGCAPTQSSFLAKRLKQQLEQLQTILRIHMDKEERVYLPLLEEHLSPIEQQQLLERIHRHERSPESTPDPAVLDVRTIPPAHRHQLILQTFDSLPIGSSLELINDHDPKPLYYQFRFERAEQFEWEYLESGPEKWRVRITKRA